MNPISIASNQANAIVIKNDSGEAVTTSLAIADGTGAQHKAVIQLVRTYQGDLDMFGRVAFEMRSFGTNGGIQSQEVAVLNEQQSAVVISYMRNSEIVRSFKLALIKGFYEMRALIQSQAPKSFAAALRLAADQQELIEKQTLKIASDAPKVAFAETIRAIDGVCHIEKIAKTLGYGRNKFFKQLREDSILMGNNLPYQKYIDREYFTVIEQEPYTDKEGVKHPTFTAMVTGAGQVFLARKYTDAGRLAA